MCSAPQRKHFGFGVISTFLTSLSGIPNDSQLNDVNLSIVPHAVNFQDHVETGQRRDRHATELLDGHT